MRLNKSPNSLRPTVIEQNQQKGTNKSPNSLRPTVIEQNQQKGTNKKKEG